MVPLDTSVRNRKPRLSSLDLLRITAASLVLFYHIHTIWTPIAGKMPFGGLFQSGSSRGVDIFFVLTGFSILYRHAEDIGQPRKWTTYISRRILRIYPAALIMTILAIIIYQCGFGGPEKAYKLEFHNILLSATLMAERSASVLNVAWTLKYVVFYYILFGFAVLDFAFGAAALLVWQSLILLHVYLGFGTSEWDAYFLQPFGLEFGIGMVCGIVMLRLHGRLRINGCICLLILGVAGFILCKLFESYLLHHDLSTNEAVWIYGTCTALTIVGLGSLELHGLAPMPRFVPLLGSASFSVYLVNYSIIVVVTKEMQYVGVPVGGNLGAFTLATVVILCGLLFDVLVDRPIQRCIGRILKPTPAARTLTVSAQHASNRA